MSGPQDAGSTHVLEAVIMATIMVSAVAYVATFETPPESGTPTRDMLKRSAQDALDGLYDTPVEDSNFGENALSVLLAECMGGNCTNLSARIERVLPKGTSHAVYLSNGYATFPVYVPDEPEGEAVTATHLLEPRWSHSFVATGTSNVNPATDALISYSLPVFNSNTLAQGGSPLRVLVHGTRTSDGANYTLTGFYSTQAAPLEDKDLTPAVTLTWRFNGRPQPATDLTGQVLHPQTGLPNGKAVPLTLRVDETAGVPVPAGTELTVSLPRGWSGYADAAMNPGWTLVSNAPRNDGAYDGSDVVARLASEVKGGGRDFVFNVTYHGDSPKYYPFHARLSKGALSEASLLVRGDKSTQRTDLFAVPMVGMSVPRPMGATAATNWTLTVYLPDKVDEKVAMPSASLTSKPQLESSVTRTANSDTAPDIVIHRIEIIEQDGARIFDDVEGILSNAGGAWRSEGDRLVWEGKHSNSRGPLSLAFSVTGSGEGGAATSKNPFTPPVLFDDYKSRMLTQVAPGFHRAVTLPESAGKYGGYSTVGGTASITHDVRSDAIYKSTLLPGKWNYTLNPLPSFQDSIHGSYVNIDHRNVPLNGEVTVTADVQSLLFALSQAGVSAGVNLHVYPPWAGDVRTPIWSQKNLDAGLLQSDVTRMMLMDLNADGRDDVVVGTSNGRVLALDGITGARLQGDVFTAALHAGGKGTMPSITHLLPYAWKGESYIVVGTDEEGEGIYVLDKSLRQRWVHNKSGHEAVSMDTSVDIDGDGGKDILLALSNSAVYVLSAHDGKAQDLRMIKSDHPDALPGAFYQGLGRPTALVGLDRTGPEGAQSGFALTFQSTPGVVLDIDPNDPLGDGTSVGVSSLPRSGFQGVLNDSRDTWTFFGSPISVAQRYDHDRDPVTDIVAGSPAGYVHMMNGRTATQPLYSQVHAAAALFIDAEARDPFNMVALTKDGQTRVTTTGWNDYTCAYCSLTGNVPTTKFPQARGIGLNATHSFWIVGAGNLLLRSVPGFDPETQEERPQYPQLAVVKPNVTHGLEDNPATQDFDPDGEPGYFDGRTFDLNDVTFRWGSEGGVGWVVAGVCKAVLFQCEESLVMRTDNGGHSWKAYGAGVPVSRTDTRATLLTHEGTRVTAELTRINFTTRDVGWIVGSQGTLLRTLDGGETFRGVGTPTTDAIVDVSCAPRNPGFCVILTQTRAWRTFNALSTDPAKPVAWEELALDVTSTTKEAAIEPRAPQPLRTVPATELYTKSLKSVAVLDERVAFIGAENMIFKSLDGAANWSTMPMNYLEADASRIVGFPDGRGFLFGGNVSHGRIFFMHDHQLSARAQTPELLDLLPQHERLAEGEKIVRVDVFAHYSGYLDTLAEFEVSVDGVNWTPISYVDDLGEPRSEGATSTYVQTFQFGGYVFEGDTGKDPAYGKRLRLGMDLKTPGDSTLYTPQIRSLHVKLLIATSPTTARTVELPLDLRDPLTYRDAARTTAVWDHVGGVIHLPLVDEYWTRNVSGEVKAIATGHHVAGDWRSEVWVGTGGVLAANSPEHVAYAGSDLDKYVKDDNRVYLLDGANGTILARTASFPGNVTNLRLSDADGKNGPEILYVTTWDPARGNGTLVALAPNNLTHLWTVYLDIHNPSDLLSSLDRNGGPAAVVGTKAAEQGQNAIPGKIYSFYGEDGAPNWGAIPDQQGKYVIKKKVPVEWFFGPYVAEVEVTWTHEVPDEAGAGAGKTTRSILQRARFYDYFMVTPPDALAPPSPVYQVHLVSWFDDWR